MQKNSDPNIFYQFFLGQKRNYQNFVAPKKQFNQNLFSIKFCLPKNIFHQNFRKLTKNIEVKIQKNQLISAKQHNLIITRNGFDIIVN